MSVNALLAETTARAIRSSIHRGSPEPLERPGAFDAIVVGGGAAGGLAAERLTQGGLTVLVLDAGYRPAFVRDPVRRFTAEAVSRLANPGFMPFMPASLLRKGRKALRLVGSRRQPVQSICYAWERRPDGFVDDLDCPYTTPEDRPFLWIRSRGLGGRVAIPGHGRLYFRLGQDVIGSPGSAPSPWPFPWQEIDPWYAMVEKRIGMSGTRDGLPWLPDSEITHPLTASPAQAALIELLRHRWPGYRPVLGRFAPPADTLEGASRTGRLTLRRGAIVRAVAVENGRATGVHWFDQATRSDRKSVAPLVFLCASALESARILLLSQDRATGRTIGARSGALGRYLMDHIMIEVEGIAPALPGDHPVLFEPGRCVYLPRFDARESGLPGPGRGFGVQVYECDMALDRSYFQAASYSEMEPRPENRVVLHPQRVDRWGIPVLHIDCSHSDYDLALATRQIAALHELAEAARATLHQPDPKPLPPGYAVHECGTARMGRDPAASVLDPHNQCWDAAGLYVTDSSSFPSQGTQNPTLTVMALTARACGHAMGNGLASIRVEPAEAANPTRPPLGGEDVDQRPLPLPGGDGGGA